MTTRRASLQFLGATGTVTGSRFLIESNGSRVLVDCGMFQGLKRDRLRNWDQFPVDPASIDVVVLTHAHIDHSGYLPALVRHGFSGRIVASADTVELCGILLPDAAHLQEEDARYANKKGFSRHHPALPLFDHKDADDALRLFEAVDIGTKVKLVGEISLELSWAGHILGATSALITVPGESGDRRLFFTGDVGRPDHPILTEPDAPPASDLLITESTYGDRRHVANAEDLDLLAEIITDTASRGGSVLIPAFAVDRTEIVLNAIYQLEKANRIPSLPIFVDSPMALNVLEVYRRALKRNDRFLRPELDDIAPFSSPQITECRTVEDSIGLAKVTYPSIIISASGMATGGRVLHHLKRLLPDERNSVLMSGFQAEGTRGRRLAEGEPAIKIFGQYVPVKATTGVIDGFSVHADGDELVEWLRKTPGQPETCFVVHGGPEASAALRDRLDHELDWNAVVPRYLERVRIE